MKQKRWNSKLPLVGGWLVLILGIVGPCLRWYDQKAHYMAMPTIYEQLSWFALGGAFAVIGAWLAFRLKPWWLYTGILVLLIGAYIGLIKYAEAVDDAQLVDFMFRSIGR